MWRREHNGDSTTNRGDSSVTWRIDIFLSKDSFDQANTEIMAKHIALPVLTVFMIVASVDDLFAQRGGGRRGGGGRRRSGRRTTSAPRVEQQPLNVQRSEGRPSRTGLYAPNTPRIPVMPSGILGTVPPPTTALLQIPDSRTKTDRETDFDKPRRRASPRPYIHLWRDKSGKYSIRGDLAAYKDGIVWIKRDEGWVSKIPLKQLSSADQDYVARLSSQWSTGSR